MRCDAMYDHEMVSTTTWNDQVRHAEGVAAQALRDEATVMARAQHPGVAVIRALVDDGASVTLTIGHPGGPLLDGVVLTLQEIAGVFAVLATTIADLHHLGVTINRLDGATVIVGSDGRPTVIDLSHARCEHTVAGAGGDQRVATDDRMLGSLLAATLGRCAPHALAAALEVPRTRWRSVLRLRRSPQGLAQTLGALAAAAERGQMTARQMSARLVGLDARLPGRTVSTGMEPWGPRPLTTGPSDEPGAYDPGPAPMATTDPDVGSGSGRRARAQTPPRWRPLVIVVCGALGTTLVWLAVASPSRPHAMRASASAATPLCLEQSLSGSCLSPATYAAGVLHTVGGNFAVGRPGDVLAAGRWTCSGDVTLALLRPDRGEVWAFSRWPAAQESLTARPVAHVAHARTLSTRAGTDCDTLVVGRDDNSTLVMGEEAFR